MNALVITLVVKASLLIAAAGVANALMRGRTSAASRHLVWMLALVGVLSLPAFSAVVPAWGIPIAASSLKAASLDAPRAAIEVSAPLTVIDATSASVATPATSAAIEPVNVVAPATSVRREIPWTLLALGLYAAVSYTHLTLPTIYSV